MTATELTPRFFVAVAAILVFCRALHWVFGRIGQPPVVAEMVGGVLLGPSLLGEVWPRAENALFPAAIHPVIYVAGQIGLIALMYQAGRELRTYLSRALAGRAGTISVFGTAVPLLFGVVLVYLLHSSAPVVHGGVSVFVTAAFVGVALAITAFPMLAKIILERGMGGSRVGSLALASGALDDVVAWLLLAGVLSIASGHRGPIVKAVAGAVLFALVLLLVVRPALTRYFDRTDLAPSSAVFVIMALLFLAAWYTDEIGLYAVFGAFSLGAVVPRTPAAEQVTPVMGTLSQLFVPMFFVYSGLNTHFSSFSDGRVLVFALAAVAVAVVGKFGACWLGAVLAGETTRDAAYLGALMNARGLMQLIALNVGLQAGIVTQSLFSSLVLVALVTTVMTAPVLQLLDRRSPAEQLTPEPVQ